MKLKKNQDYNCHFPDSTRRVQFLCFVSGKKGVCRVADPHGKGSAVKEVARSRITALDSVAK